MQRTITFVWGSVSTITYNGSLQGIELAISNIAGTDVLSFVFNTTAGVEGTSIGNCTVSNDSANNKVTVTNTAVSLSVAFEAINYGTYTVSINSSTGISGAKAANYNLTGQTLSKSWTIGKKQITFTLTSSSPFTYIAQTEQGVVVKVNGIVAGDNIILSTNTTGGTLTTNELNGVAVNSSSNYNLKAIDAGNYSTVVSTTITGTSASNYELPAAVASRTFAFVINKNS